MPAEYIEDADSVTLTVEGVAYRLARRLTGQQYVELRNKAIKIIINGSGQEETKLDSPIYEYWNLVLRLLEPVVGEEGFKSLTRLAYQALSLLASKLDAEEATEISDFLQENSERFRLASTGEPSLDSLPPITEA